MANETKITQLVGATAFSDLASLRMALAATQKDYLDVVKEIGEGIKFKPTSFNGLIEKSEKYKTSLEKLAESVKRIEILQEEQTKILSQLGEATDKTTSAIIEEATANKLNSEATLAVTKSETERIKAQKLLDQISRTRKATEEELTKIINTEAKSISEAEEQNRKLRYAVKNVSDEDVNAARKKEEYNRKIDENTVYIKKNSDAMVRQKMTIGDYKNQIIEAFRGQKTFTEGVKSSIATLKEQKVAIGIALAAFIAYNAILFAFQQAKKFITDSIQTIRDFEKANSTLASILGTTSKEIKELTSDARRLGAVTAATASQVTELQTELAKLGFDKKEILESTEAVLQFALATGASLPDAAALAGAALRMFDADAKEMDRYVSAMAISTNRSALSFSKLATAMPIVGPVAKSFGFEIEDVLTLLGKLSDAGMDASMSATATRNILLNLADANGKLAKALGQPVRNIEELQDALVKLDKKGVDLNTMLELTDKRSVAAFARFKDGASTMTEFKKSITDVNDEMKKAAEERVNNLSGSLTKLSSAWNELMLMFSGSSGTLKTTVDFMTILVVKLQEFSSTGTELAEKLVNDAKKASREIAKHYKVEEYYYKNIAAIKGRLINQGVKEADAQKIAASQVVSEVQERYDKEIAIAKKYEAENVELQKKRESASFLKQRYGFEMTEAQYRNELDRTLDLYKTSIAKAERYKYTLEMLQKHSEDAAKKDAETAKYKIELSEKELSALEKAAAEKLKIQAAFEESKMAIMDEGYERERLKLTLSFQKKIDAVKGNSAEEIETRKNLAIEMSKSIENFDSAYQLSREKADLSNRLASVEKNSLEELDLRIDLLSVQEREELKAAEKTGASKAEINKKYLQLIGEEFDKFAKAQLKNEEGIFSLQLSAQQIAQDKEISQLSSQYQKGKIGKEQYEKEKADIVFKYAKQALEYEIDMLEKSLDILSGDERLQAEQKLASSRASLSKLTTDKIISDAERELEKKEEIEKAKLDLIKQVQKAAIDITNSMFERSIQNVDEEIEANRDATDEKIKNIEHLEETGAITKEEAEARKRSAEELSSQKNTELEKKKADLQTRQAKFQKAADLTQAIIATALAVTKAFPNLILAGLVAAMGAVQVATILAQPIPKYAKGTDFHKGGPAIVGDGGKHEAIVVGDKTFITPSIPTMVDIPMGAKVLPDLTSREFLDRCVNQEYWLTHNQKGEPINIINNNDYSKLERKMDDNIKAINNVAKMIAKNSRAISFQNYKML